MTSYAEAIADAERQLRAAEVPQSRRDARLLLADLLGCDVSTLIAWPERRLSKEAKAAFHARIERRAAREPVSRILGRREFWSLSFLVSPETLDPRPDSEAVVAALLEQLGDHELPLRVLDLGTGSGCLLLSLLRELPNATGVGVDCSAGALETARENAQRLQMAGRAEFRSGHWCEGLDEVFDLLVCNPPYIPDGEVAELDPEVAAWDPRGALAGGVDGLSPYRVILPHLKRLLTPRGVAGFEHGPGQAPAIEALLRPEEGWITRRGTDLGGRDRALIISSGGHYTKNSWKAGCGSLGLTSSAGEASD